MALYQLNRFCGVVAKNGKSAVSESIEHLPYTKSIGSNVHFFSSVEIDSACLFDGYVYNIESNCFEHDHLQSYDGNWSAAEIKENVLYLSRDRVGVRSIYYFENDDFFCFANEIKSLLDLSFIPFKVSSSAAFRFLFLSDNDTLGDNLFEGIIELPPSSFLKYDFQKSTIEVLKYYDYLNELQEESDDLESVASEIEESLREIIGTIVENRTELGSLLSGGIDSSAIAVSIAKNEKHHELPFITAMSGDEKVDEVKYAEIVVRQLGIKNWNQVLVQNIDKEIEAMHLAMELPTLSAGSYLQYEMMRFCQHRGIKYVLDGTGADALYAGHKYYHTVYWNSLIRKRSFNALAEEIGARKGEGFWLIFYAKQLIRHFYSGKVSPNRNYQLALRKNQILGLLSSDLVRENSDVLDQITARSMKNLNIFLKQDFFGGGVRKLLRFPDRFGKAFGVMNLSIFSDHKALFEKAFNIAPELKIHHNQLKYVLRYAFKNYLPKEILGRKDKMGLVAPNNSWMKEHKDLLLTYFDQDLSIFFKMDEIKVGLGKAIDELGDQEDYKLFKFVSFAIWYKVFNEKYNS